MWFEIVIIFAFMGSALFLSAGTINYWQAWVYLGEVTISSIPLTVAMIKDPQLLESRTKTVVERRPIQRIIVLCAGLSSIATLIVPGIDHRFSWSSMPFWLSIAGNLLIIASLWLVYLVFKENSFGSATVEISKDQTVVSTGPYAIVRNPMYASAAVYFIGTSLALGSYWGLIPSVLAILCFVWRLFDEEKLLVQNLPGYREYCAKVRWHLIPGIF